MEKRIGILYQDVLSPFSLKLEILSYSREEFEKEVDTCDIIVFS
jgi:hypothetical protein